MDYMEILKGNEEPLSIYTSIVRCLENIDLLPFLVEPIFNEALSLTGDDPDKLHFALVRVQVYADIHRNEDIELAQKIKYSAQVLEKVIFGNLMLGMEDTRVD